MLILKGLVLATALINSAFAFHPYFPPYRCFLDGDCAPETEADAQLEPRNEGGFSLKIFQRVPEIEIPHPERVRQVAQRLARKYHPSRTNDIEKRTNTFNIDAAATPTQPTSAGIDQDGTDFSYFAEVTVGSRNTPLYMLLDTGAGTSWVMGTTCSSVACLSHNTFGSANSTTLKTTSGTFSIAYGSGTVAGNIINDTLSIAGITLSVSLGIANQTSDDFNHFPFDGILGLSQSNAIYPNFLQTLVASKALKSNVFGVALNRAADGTANNGEINFGAPDTSKYTGDLSYLDVSSHTGGDWAIPLGKVGNGTASSAITGTLGYVDTGTSFIFASPADAATFHSMIPGSNHTGGGTYSVPCSTTTDATFTFGSTTYTVSSKDWVSPEAKGVCTSNIYGQDIVSGNWLLGDTFIKNVYAVFDVDQNRLGLAQRPVATGTTSSAVSTGTSSTSSTSSFSTTVPAGLTISLDETMTTATKSNGMPTGTRSSSTATATSTGVQSAGIDGHESSSAKVSAASETTPPSASGTATKQSNATQRTSHLLSLALAITVLVTMIS